MMVFVSLTEIYLCIGRGQERIRCTLHLPLKLSSKRKGILPVVFFVKERFKIFIASSLPKSEIFSSSGISTT